MLRELIFISAIVFVVALPQGPLKLPWPLSGPWSLPGPWTPGQRPGPWLPGQRPGSWTPGQRPGPGQRPPGLPGLDPGSQEQPPRPPRPDQPLPESNNQTDSSQNYNTSVPTNSSSEWWRDSFIYQIYPRSFKDSNGDGVGDLKGILEKIDHFVDMNVSAFWLSPIFQSPMVDFGYDISNFTAIDPIFGTIEDFNNLTEAAHKRGLKVILDWVPNHSSDDHPWFNKSVHRIKPYDDYYIWKDAKIVNGTRQPPNNWLSVFLGSAWEWNDIRQQYYLHQFAVRQPDLNFRNADLRKEMEDALVYWAKNGADGFRIDSMIFMYEDDRFLDEPVIPNTGKPANDPATLKHIYTVDQPETYDLLKSWRQKLDSLGGEKLIIMTEAYTSLPLTVKYYEYGSNVPFNFMFVTGLNNKSSALDFKRSIDSWLNSIPEGDYIANWVVDNHDNPRVANRLGPKRADELTMLAAVLPGVGVVFNGDEIGMIGAYIPWEQTVDPQACNAGLDNYLAVTRDPERTPYQWDNSTSAGFSSNNKTWLPVNPNYQSLNLANQKDDPESHYGIFKRLVALKSNDVIKKGDTEVLLATENVLSVIRRLPKQNPIVLLINFANKRVTFDAQAWLNIPSNMTVYAPSVGSNTKIGIKIGTSKISLPAAASVVLT
ncbi:alpha-glucosidase-like [Microplitis demolitor]|uniref:alpha-glucosidase-like n=1 Tax=Microplitis demolitor TaxID=69319 RepID=UPI0004400364|nr:alpha-glucosidase-like [Microplitis demolitor]